MLSTLIHRNMHTNQKIKLVIYKTFLNPSGPIGYNSGVVPKIQSYKNKTFKNISYEK